MAASKLSPFLLSNRSPISLLFQFLHFSSIPQNYDSAINNKNVNSNTLIVLLNSDPDPISAVHHFQHASRQKNFRHTPTTYAHLISKLVLAGKTQEMDELLKEMVRFQHPDAESSFQLLVESFCRNGRPREALKVFETAILGKFKLSVLTCNALLSALVEERLKLDEVVFVYKEMVKVGILPNVDTLNCLIKCLVDNGRIELALGQFDKMEKKNCKPNSLSFEILICGLCSRGRVDEAVRVCNQMVEIGCSRNRDFYVSVIPWICRVCRLDEAVKLFQLMTSDVFLPDLYLCGVLIGFLCENLRVDDAVEVFEEMRKLGVTPVTCWMLVDITNAYCKISEFSKAIRLLEKNNCSDAEPYNELLRGLCYGSGFQGAISYFNKMQEKGTSDGHSWNILIRCLCDKGDVRKAFEVIGKMIVSSCFPDEATYSSVVSGFCKMCSYDRALDWFQQGLAKNTSFDSESCSDLIKGLCHSEKVDDAVKIFYCISSRGCALNTNALNILIQGLCLRGKVSEAIKLRSIACSNGTASSPFTYEIVMLGLFDLRKEKDVLPLLSHMLIEGCILNSKIYHILIHGLCIKNTRWAALLFNQMIEEGLIPDPETLEKLVYSASKCSQLHLVVHGLNKVIEDVRFDSPVVCNIITYGLLKEGRKDEARKFLDWMLEKGWIPDSDTHGLLVGGFDAERTDGIEEGYEDGDGVSNILSEGLRDFR